MKGIGGGLIALAGCGAAAAIAVTAMIQQSPHAEGAFWMGGIIAVIALFAASDFAGNG